MSLHPYMAYRVALVRQEELRRLAIRRSKRVGGRSPKPSGRGPGFWLPRAGLARSASER
jgi:hypothetical protein